MFGVTYYKTTLLFINLKNPFISGGRDCATCHELKICRPTILLQNHVLGYHINIVYRCHILSRSGFGQRHPSNKWKTYFHPKGVWWWLCTGLSKNYFCLKGTFYHSKRSNICIWITSEDLELIDIIVLVI